MFRSVAICNLSSFCGNLAETTTLSARQRGKRPAFPSKNDETERGGMVGPWICSRGTHGPRPRSGKLVCVCAHARVYKRPLRCGVAHASGGAHDRSARAFPVRCPALMEM